MTGEFEELAVTLLCKCLNFRPNNIAVVSALKQVCGHENFYLQVNKTSLLRIRKLNTAAIASDNLRLQV
jgi:hypothetical protein